MKAAATLILSLALAAGCARPRPTLTPEQRATAMGRWIHGATTDQIAAEFSLDHDQARFELRTGLLELNRRYTRGR
jgi:hypothetical protein